MEHRIRRTLGDRLKSAVPFGIGQQKPQHFADFPAIILDNIDNAGYAWKVLSKGVCDGCALGVAGFHDWTIPGLHLCMTRLNLLRLNTMPSFDAGVLADISALQKKSNAELRQLGRIPYPFLRKRGERSFRRIDWSEAFGRIADRIRSIHDRRRLAFYLTSRGLTNETYYVAQKVARLLGTNNIENAARLCHSPSTGAMKATIGVGASTCSYKDWLGTDILVFFGSNPANDQPVAVKYIREARRRGTKVILVNPYLEPGMNRYWIPSVVRSAMFGSDISDFWFPVAQGGDIAFLYGVIKALLAQPNSIDDAFLQAHTTGAEDVCTTARNAAWQELEQASGLQRASMEEFANLIAKARTGVFVWSMGITQHANGAEAVQMILNTGLLRGFIGRERCGLMPIRGHSGVQGGAEMGAYATVFPGGKPVNESNATALADHYGFNVPSQPGLAAVAMIEAAHRGELDLLYCVGGNFLRALPDPVWVEQALATVPMRVHQDIILTDQMLIDAQEETILLPAQTRYEQEGGGTQTTTERRIAFSPQLPRQVGEARAEWRILRDIAAAVDPEHARLLGCDSGEEIRREIADVIPAYKGIETLKGTGDAIQYGGPRLCEAGKFPTPDGKAHLKAVPLREPQRTPGCFHVSTRRGKQFNTIVYAETDPLTGASRDAVLMSADDATALDLRNGDKVQLSSQAGAMEATVMIAPIAPGNLQVHWPEGNILLSRGRIDPTGGVPDYNAIVTVERL